MNAWTDWYDLEPHKAVPAEFETSFGIYRIRVVDTNGRPFVLGRMLGSDDSGLVYIGRSGEREAGGRTVGWGLKEWISRGHSGANTYDRAKKVFSGGFVNHRLQVSALFLPVNEVISREAQEIESYRMTFGEPPPFNSNTPGLE